MPSNGRFRHTAPVPRQNDEPTVKSTACVRGEACNIVKAAKLKYCPGLKIMVGASGFEPSTSWSRTSLDQNKSVELTAFACASPLLIWATWATPVVVWNNGVAKDAPVAQLDRIDRVSPQSWHSRCCAAEHKQPRCFVLVQEVDLSPDEFSRHSQSLALSHAYVRTVEYGSQGFLIPHFLRNEFKVNSWFHPSFFQSVLLSVRMTVRS
jgi:hypothetical protein